MNEEYVTWWTESGYIAVPKSEAAARLRGAQQQPGIDQMQNQIAELQMQNVALSAKVYSLEKAINKVVDLIEVLHR